jgi:hypothetical protein
MVSGNARRFRPPAIHGIHFFVPGMHSYTSPLQTTDSISLPNVDIIVKEICGSLYFLQNSEKLVFKFIYLDCQVVPAPGRIFVTFWPYFLRKGPYVHSL